jgi:hypothetical protein
LIIFTIHEAKDPGPPKGAPSPRVDSFLVSNLWSAFYTAPSPLFPFPFDQPAEPLMQ